jgi:hypothetical protein
MSEFAGAAGWWLSVAVGGVAFLYSSVGHGGATAYLALMAWLGVGPDIARPGALWMNCLVAGIAFGRFRRAGAFDQSVFLPLGLVSVPSAWLGSQLTLAAPVYAVVLGLVLTGCGGLLLWSRGAAEGREVSRPAWPLLGLAGGGLGLLAGATGIGGGVFLTPLLVLSRWTTAKVAGGVSALFILANSMAGLAGLGSRAWIWDPVFLGGLVLGAAGAFCGSWAGVRRWGVARFRYALALVLWIAAGKLLINGL